MNSWLKSRCSRAHLASRPGFPRRNIPQVGNALHAFALGVAVESRGAMSYENRETLAGTPAKRERTPPPRRAGWCEGVQKASSSAWNSVRGTPAERVTCSQSDSGMLASEAPMLPRAT